MMILMTQGGWGVQNWPKVDDVIYERSLTSICYNFLDVCPPVLPDQGVGEVLHTCERKAPVEEHYVHCARHGQLSGIGTHPSHPGKQI